MTATKAWAVHPPSGKGVVRVRVVVDTNLPTNPDATWLDSQLVIGLGIPNDHITPTQLIWSDPDAQRT